ncbi:DEAD/DEAH box helicase [Chlamydiifrater phoenicopteri]|uniref:DEAD/DEAH box helicase n=1 Tax=Chlamydiifrater phoenicopteri TaxID=2681469 RepID=UPI001BCEDC55|nr:DEAD/DEAH box helicase [Chlamydiifrater phoenicopteri]
MLLNSLLAHACEAHEQLDSHRDNVIIDFIRNSYEVHFPSDESPDGFWTSFLKFDLTNPEDLIFTYCNCPDGEDCFHPLASYLALEELSFLSPLHSAFKSSFWNQLFYHLFERNIAIHPEPNHSFSFNDTSCSLFISCSNSEAFALLDTFSKESSTPPPLSALLLEAFSKQEISAWREGHTSIEIDYALSPHYFLAKHFYLYQLKTGILELEENEEKQPFIFSIKSPFFFLKGSLLSFSFAEKVFPNILFEKTNLPYWPKNYTLSDIRISENPVVLQCKKLYEPLPEKLLENPSISIGNTRYILGKGIVRHVDNQLTLPFSKIEILPRQLKQKLFSILPYEQTPSPVHYEMQFLRDASLVANAYLTTPGDLANALVISNSLLHVPEKGLVAITELPLKEKDLIVKASDVDHFLNTYGEKITAQGFTVHKEKEYPGELTYSVTSQGTLLFRYQLDETESQTTEIIFDQWIFFSGYGFFPKLSLSTPVQDGTTVEAKDVHKFIEENSDSLAKVRNFFSQAELSEKLLLEVSFNDKTSELSLTPTLKDYSKGSYHLFGSYLYREGKGFSLIPEELQPMSSYVGTIPSDKVSHFMTEILPIHSFFQLSDKSLQLPQKYNLIVTSISSTTENRSLQLELTLQTNIGELPLSKVLLALKKKKPFLVSDAGFLNLENNLLFQFLAQFLPKNFSPKTNSITASATDIFKLDALASLRLAPNVRAADCDLQFFKQLTQIKDSCLPPLPTDKFSVNHKLRPYQESGLLWLWFLYGNRLSGLLCDEMGLGKTHQAVALLDIVFQTSCDEESRPSFLVVCPTSVLSHWEHILKSNLPNARTASFHGPEKPSSLPDVDLVLTSYGTLRQNYQLFFNKNFTVAVFDEIHMAKNKNSQTHKVLARLNARMKLGLTGTPVENNILEFKGLIDTILPNYLPSDSMFKKMFSKKMGKDGDLSMKESLLKLTRPFILRRTKKHVLPDLPEKMDNTLPCALSREQETLYTSVLRRDSLHLQKLESDEESPSVYIHIFALLNHLKQICDHPAVFFKKPENYKQHTSGKWDLFLKILHEALDSGYKIVVFSQYINMIQIICLYLEEIGIKYASIQGKSLNRKEEIDTFTSDPDCRVFVGSLLASGTGINLTAGNVVIMYDRWWNPAKENQALDRVHRIGQKNKVFIYKLMTTNTLEERINMLIEAKTKLLDSVIVSQDSNILHMLNKEDLKTILSYGEDLQNQALTDSEEECLTEKKPAAEKEESGDPIVDIMAAREALNEEFDLGDFYEK